VATTAHTRLLPAAVSGKALVETVLWLPQRVLSVGAIQRSILAVFDLRHEQEVQRQRARGYFLAMAAHWLLPLTLSNASTVLACGARIDLDLTHSEQPGLVLHCLPTFPRPTLGGVNWNSAILPPMCCMAMTAP
jgi:hypothetical protein